MDGFVYVAEYRVLICQRCRYAVWPSHLLRHLRCNVHQLLAGEARRLTQDLLTRWPDLCGSPGEFTFPDAVVERIPELPYYKDGLGCRLDAGACRYVARNLESMRKHWREAHRGWGVAQGRTGGSGSRLREEQRRRRAEAMQPTYCQRFFGAGPHSSYFEIRPPAKAPAGNAALVPAASGSDAARARLELARLLEERQSEGQTLHTDTSQREVSPWLQLTRWPEYLAGHPLDKLAALATMPSVATEPGLCALSQSLDRLVDAPYPR
ncbi:uncharacterized protein K489DRAFT_413254 [Dissoconium aciculare CBS 342.82]|uniref:C2H2-type domain-containing protein n=1 Tax=Dissoconium aciculare CBS 342.82 TaxID=1314786 RepID=A0A6J3LVZ3_9PEZI|nr:uncharacterized protein K489DRAFT_413254 [Dissoconium aciculare CBS 342.82]KAF1818787.1 hypothetical protein K489DRAFT_413254 [Dissoconium aciculare CBS 342.82]